MCVFGFVTTTMLITLDVNSSYYQVYATIAEQIPDTQSNKNSGITLIGSHWWIWDSYWITQYVLHKAHSWIDPHLDPKFKQEIKTEKVMYIDDQIFLKSLASKLNSENLREIRNLHHDTKDFAIFYDNVTSHASANYPYNTLPIMIQNENHPAGTVVIKRNY